MRECIARGQVDRASIHAEFGEIISGKLPGRESADERIFFNPFGLAIEDLAVAKMVYDRALALGLGGAYSAGRRRVGRSFLKDASAGKQTLISHSPSHGRIPEVDVLRGFALFGVFLVNLFAFGGDASAWSAPIDQIVWTLKHLFFESKFWGAFQSAIWYFLLAPMARKPQLVDRGATLSCLVYFWSW